MTRKSIFSLIFHIQGERPRQENEAEAHREEAGDHGRDKEVHLEVLLHLEVKEDPGVDYRYYFCRTGSQYYESSHAQAPGRCHVNHCPADHGLEWPCNYCQSLEHEPDGRPEGAGDRDDDKEYPGFIWSVFSGYRSLVPLQSGHCIPG